MAADWSAKLAAVILLGVAAFQLLLVLGVPLGRYDWGGSVEVLPIHLRIASVVAMLVYLLAAAIVLSRAGVVALSTSDRVTHTGTRALTMLFGIGVVLNAISKSDKERLFVPVVLTLSILCFIVATSE